MKNKKIYGIVVLVIILLGVYYYLMLVNKRVKLSVHEAGNFTKYTGELPKFLIKFGGIVEADIYKEVLDVNGVIPYEFDAYVETNWGNYNNKYVGYKLSDILKIFKNQNYNSVTISNYVGLTITYSTQDVDFDKIFVVFYRDGKEFNNNEVSVISVSENENYFIEKVVNIDINNVEAK